MILLLLAKNLLLCALATYTGLLGACAASYTTSSLSFVLCGAFAGYFILIRLKIERGKK
jgi:hypothetical protein